ncbi:MAG: hypothetical protein AB1567_04985 [bacterium]
METSHLFRPIYSTFTFIPHLFHSEISERLLFVRTDEEVFADNYNEIDSSCGIERIIELLDNPLKEFSIEGVGFVPLCFEVNSEKKAEVVLKDGIFSLKMPTLEERLECHIKAICQKDTPLLYIHRKGGVVQTTEGKEEKAWFDLPSWQNMQEELKPIIKAGISKKEFRCPQCDMTHKYDTLLCPQGDVILQGLPLFTCILFTKDKYLSLTDWFAYPLDDNQKIITKDGNLYCFEDNMWKFKNKISLYEKIDDEVWAVFNKI